MIGLDFPIKPQWIHDVHYLWRPAQPVSELVEAAVSQTMQELGGDKARRNSLTVILRYFVATEGHSRSRRRTAAQDVWAAYARAYPASTLAPAYLAHLIAQNEVAQEASRFITRRYVPGDLLTSSELRRHVVAQFGERKVVTNAVSAFLRTLQYFGILSPGERLGEYQIVARLPVPREAFPLVVWAWWQAHLSPQIDLDDFGEDPALTFLESEGFAGHWAAYRPVLWVLEERLDVRRATLKYGEADTFEQALLGLLPPVP
jgi:hypothetical protein